MSWLLKNRIIMIFVAVLGTLLFTIQPSFAATAADDVATVFLKAANKTIGKSSYKASTQVVLSNFSPDLAKQLNISPDQKITFIDLTGTYAGEQYSSLQRIDPLLGGSYLPAKGLELVYVDGTYYVHGPFPEIGAPKSRWYSDPSLELYAPTLDHFGALRGLMQADLKQLKPQRDEKIDSVSCKTYSITDRKLTAKALASVYGGTGEADPSRILNSSINLAVCADGFVRRVALNFDFDCGCKDSSVQGNREAEPVAFRPTARSSTLVVSFAITTTYTLYDKPVTIQAPPDALPLEQVQYNSGYIEAVVFNGGNIRAEPNLRGKVLGQLHAGQRVELIERTADSRWYYVNAPEAPGWVNASLLTLYEGTAQSVPITGQATSAVPSSTTALTARVYNGGNVRATPNARGQVLDQINAGESVILIERSSDGIWYKITNSRNVTGWVHRTLLTVDPEVAKRVPTAR